MRPRILCRAAVTLAAAAARAACDTNLPTPGWIKKRLDLAPLVRWATPTSESLLQQHTGRGRTIKLVVVTPRLHLEHTQYTLLPLEQVKPSIGPTCWVDRGPLFYARNQQRLPLQHAVREAADGPQVGLSGESGGNVVPSGVPQLLGEGEPPG